MGIGFKHFTRGQSVELGSYEARIVCHASRSSPTSAFAWPDLRPEPLVLNVPDTHDRYDLQVHEAAAIGAQGLPGLLAAAAGLGYISHRIHKRFRVFGVVNSSI